MMQISASKVATGVTRTLFFGGSGIDAITAVAQFDHAVAREKPTIAGIASRKDAVEHIDPSFHRRHNILGHAHTHEIAPTGRWQRWCGMPQDPQHFLLGLPYR